MRFKQTTSDLITSSWSVYLRTIRLNRFPLFSEDPGLLEDPGWTGKIFLLEYLESEIELISGHPSISHLKNQLCLRHSPNMLNMNNHENINKQGRAKATYCYSYFYSFLLMIFILIYKL